MQLSVVVTLFCFFSSFSLCSAHSWHHKEPVLGYITASMTPDYVLGGTGYTVPDGVIQQIYSIKGAPVGQFNSQYLYTVAGPKYFAFLNATSSSPGKASLSVQNYTQKTPLWTFDIPGQTFPAFSPKGTIRYTLDGSMLFLAVNNVDCQCGNIYWFDPTKGTLLGSFSGDQITDFQVSKNGTILTIFFYRNATLTVLNTKTNQLIWSTKNSLGAPNGMFCMDPDANYIGYGLEEVGIYGWRGDTYQLLRTYGLKGEFASVCAIGGEGGKYSMLVASTNAQLTQNRVYKWSLQDSVIPSSPDWVWDGPLSRGNLQDAIGDMQATPTGNYFALAGWGNQENTSPQVLLFSPSNPAPIFTYITSGSMMDVNILQPTATTLQVAVAGLHAHLELEKLGGDLYFFHIPI